MSAGYTRMQRLFEIVMLIQGKRGLTSQTLANRFQVDQRTIRRDLEILKDASVPCYHDPETGGYVIRKGFFMPPVEFTFDEALSLLTLLEQIPAEEQIPHLAAARRALQKIRSQLRDDIRSDIEQLEGKMQVDLARGTGDDGSEDVYEKVRRAIMLRRVLRCRYQANQSATEGSENEIFELRPYVLWYCQRAFYVVGLHCGRGQVRQLKLSRFTYVEMTGKPFAIPDDFSIKSYLGNAWRMVRGEKEYQVAIRFDGNHAVTVAEVRWHPTQEETQNQDGSVTLRFTVAGLEEIKWFVLGYGPFAQVLEPKELADEVRELAQATARRYGAEP